MSISSKQSLQGSIADSSDINGKVNVGVVYPNETDPTVPDWAKQPDKPTYTAEEVGAVSSETGGGLLRSPAYIGLASTTNVTTDSHAELCMSSSSYFELLFKKRTGGSSTYPTFTSSYIRIDNDKILMSEPLEFASSSLVSKTRTNMGVYSKAEVDEAISNATSSNATSSIILTDSVTGLKYELKIVNGNITTALLAKELKITKQPPPVVEALINEPITLSVEAEGDGLTYQWEVLGTSSSSTWKSSTSSGNKTNTLQFTATRSIDGYWYRCQITDSAGNTVISDIVNLMVFLK